MEVQELKLSAIKADPKQPRKTFDMKALELLSENIAEVGVLQPITVRPAKSGHIIVMGERRYRASKLAKLKTIPCIVRDFDSDMINEVQIIENIQRENVEPMEEADAIAFLLQRYTADEISKRLGRTTRFIHGRLKLANLIEGFRKFVATKEMTLSLGISVASFPVEQQEEMLEGMGESFSSHQVKSSVNKLIYDLEKAPFDLDDEKLVEKAGACCKCPFNTMNQGFLFGEEKQICTRASCFTNKKSKHLLNIIEKSKRTKTLLIGNFDSRQADSEENLLFISILEEQGIKTVYRNELDFIREPVEPTLETVKEQYKYYSWEDEEYLQELGEQIDTFKEKKDAYEKASKDGYKTALFINTGNYGSSRALVKKIEETEKTTESVPLTNKKMSECTPKEKIAKIEKKAARKEELASHREFAEISETIKASDYMKITKELTKDEMVAFCISFYENTIEWQLKENVIGFYPSSRSKSKEKIVDIFKKNFKKEKFNQLVRVYLLQSLRFHERDHHNDIVNNSFYKALKTYCKKEMEAIELEYATEREKRQQRKKERIEELEKLS